MMREVELMDKTYITGKICAPVSLNVFPTKKGRKKDIEIIIYL